MGSKPVKQPEMAEFQLHVRYDLNEIRVQDLLEAIHSLVDAARGDGEVVSALLCGMPQPLDLK